MKLLEYTSFVRCLICQYDLKSLPEHRCPQCGLSNLRTFAGSRIRISSNSIAVAVMIAIVLPVCGSSLLLCMFTSRQQTVWDTLIFAPVYMFLTRPLTVMACLIVGGLIVLCRFVLMKMPIRTNFRHDTVVDGLVAHFACN